MTEAEQLQMINRISVNGEAFDQFMTASAVRSDERDKADFELLDSRYTDLIDVLDTYTFVKDKREYYTYRDKETDEVVRLPKDGSLKGTRRQLGIKAEDVPIALNTVGLTTQEFAPFIDSSFDGQGEDVLSFQYEGLIPILWKAVRELREEVRLLKEGSHASTL